MCGYYRINPSGRTLLILELEVHNSGNSGIHRCQHAETDIGRVSRVMETRG